MSSPIPLLVLCGQPVLIDADLARLYGVTTKRLNEQIKRNMKRFPGDFVFQITTKELANLRSQTGALTLQASDSQEDALNWSQFATSSSSRRGAVYRPYAFTEHGALMAANVLNSPAAVKMSVFIIRAFIKQREILTTNIVILKRLAEIDKTLLIHDKALRDVYHKLLPLLSPPPLPPKPKIGFQSAG